MILNKKNVALVLILILILLVCVKIGSKSEEDYSITSTLTNPIALVYREPADSSGCAEAVAALLKSDTIRNFTVIYVGPNENMSVQDGLQLPNVVLYAQPGGDGSVKKAYRELKADAAPIRNFVKKGGRYLGFCMGGYLVDDNPGYGFGLNTDQYISSSGAAVTNERSDIVQVSWRGDTALDVFSGWTLFHTR